MLNAASASPTYEKKPRFFCATCEQIFLRLQKRDGPAPVPERLSTSPPGRKTAGAAFAAADNGADPAYFSR